MENFVQGVRLGLDFRKIFLMLLEGGESEARARVVWVGQDQLGPGNGWEKRGAGGRAIQETLHGLQSSKTLGGKFPAGNPRLWPAESPPGCPAGPGVSAQLRRMLWSVWDSVDGGTSGRSQA